MVTINRAVDHLIDVLAGEDVPVVGSKATRVDQLADMIADGEIVIGGGGGGYDLVIEVDSEVTAAELKHGSYAEACAKGLQGQPLTAFVYGVVSTAEAHTVFTYGVSFVYCSDYVPEGEDNLLYVAVDGFILTVNSDDTVTPSVN
ncbi:MAG: hypothetical protein J6S63_00930 [Atopobiaceae bacterium]|nr:hypothetical protein [Atopobiaceae bacterium]